MTSVDVGVRSDKQFDRTDALLRSAVAKHAVSTDAECHPRTRQHASDTRDALHILNQDILCDKATDRRGFACGNSHVADSDVLFEAKDFLDRRDLASAERKRLGKSDDARRRV